MKGSTCLFCFSLSAPYVHGHATAVCGGEGGRQHYSELHCLRKPQAGGHLAERGRSADQQQEIHGNLVLNIFSKHLQTSFKQDQFVWGKTPVKANPNALTYSDTRENRVLPTPGRASLTVSRAQSKVHKEMIYRKNLTGLQWTQINTFGMN